VVLLPFTPRRRRFSRLCLWLALGAQAVAAETTPAYTPAYTPVAPGIAYAHCVVSNQPWSIHIARIDRAAAGLDFVTTLGHGTIQGLSTLARQAKALPPAAGRPLVGVNGDFFLIKPGPYQGDPEGLQILNGELVSAPNSACFWVENGQPHIDKVASALSVTWPDGQHSSLGLNQTPQRTAAVLFTPIFGPSTRATNHVELVLERDGRNPWLPLRAGRNYRARIRSINPAGDTRLPRDAAVLTLGSQQTNLLAGLRAGDLLQLSTALSRDLTRATIALGGGPLLVREGREQRWPDRHGTNTYLLPRHPRTALGYNPRELFLVEVDGRQKILSVGMTFAELAAFMKSLGCTDALNLDGGGSSTFWLQGRVMNSPCDKHDRALANGLFVVRKSLFPSRPKSPKDAG
jgi:hypothetical protein